MSQPLPPPSTTKRSPPSRSSSPGTSHLPLHHSSSRSSLKSLGGPSKLRDQLLVPPPRSTSPKITDVGGGERDSHQTGVDRPPGATVSAAGPTDSRAGAVGWKHRGGDKAALASLLATDPKWKKFTVLVDKSLATFDAVKEWADFISFLSKLLKTLQTYPTFTEIPRKLIVAKRLAQCLTPALPSGVHQRALDVYSHILAVIGPEGLKRDLQIWSAGLFPFFQYASTSVKLPLLNIYESFYLPLQDALRPVMKALILALLPGLDEETGEFFDKVVYLLDYVSSAVSPPFFLQNVWLILISTPSARILALNYLSRRMPKLGEGEDISPIVGPDIGLMIRAFSSSLEDDNVLVQRAILDLLVTSLRLDGAASAKHTREADRLILMRSASTVVLRRDLSLSRRLYTWLLGKDDTADAQTAYLRANGLDLLRKSLKEEMLLHSSSSDEPQRPYKVFISLLDKWEIGYPLTDVLIEDALRALKSALDKGDEPDILMTGTMLYEVVDPYLAWRRLFQLLKTDLEASKPVGDSIPLVHFVLETFKAHDEEVRQLHLPIVFAALLELIESAAATSPPSPLLSAALTLASEILHLVPASLFAASHSSLKSPVTPSADSEQALHHASTFYSLDIDLSRPAEPDYAGFSGPLLLRRSLEATLRISALACRKVDGPVSSMVTAFSLLQALLEVAGKIEVDVGDVAWNPEDWFNGVSGLLSTARSFAVVQGIVAATLVLADPSKIQPSLVIDTRPKMTLLMNGAFRYMGPTTLLYHLPAVQLIWSLQHATPSKHIDSILARDLLSLPIPDRLEAIHAFGVLWRHTEESKESTQYLDGPVFAILDSLSDPNVTIRRAGETWLRTNLKSYLRVLEPILFVLLDPLIIRTATSTTFNARESRGFHYERPFDIARTHYMLDCLAALSRFGGQSFNRTLRATSLTKLSDRIVQRATKANVTHTDATCMDVLLETLLRFIQSEPAPGLAPALQSENDRLQLNSLDSVQTIIARGDVSSIGLKSAESVVVAKLFSCIHGGKLDTQNQLLLVLHSIITVSSASAAASRRKSSVARTTAGRANPRFSTSSTDDGREDEKPVSDNVSPLLMQTLMDGISSASNRPVLQHWIDFILMTIPQFQGHLRPLLLPLCDCVVQQLDKITQGLHVALNEPSSDLDLPLASSEAEAIMFLSALERIVTLALGHFPAPSEHERGPSAETGGLFGYVSNVFSTEQEPTNSKTAGDGLMPRSAGLKCFSDAVGILQALWSVANSPALSSRSLSSSSSEGLQHVCSRSSARCQKVLEQLYRLQPIEVVQTLAERWSTGDETLQLAPQGSMSSFEILDLLAPNAQTVVSMLCANWSKSDRPSSRGSGAEPVLYSFTEVYLSRLEGPIAIQVWATFISLAKDVAASNASTPSKSQVFPTLRCLTALAEKVASTSALEDRRLRRDLQDTYTKLVEATITLAARSHELSPPPRRWTPTNAHSRPGTPVQHEKANGVDAPASDLYTTIATYIVAKVLPNLRPFLQDTDKVASICSSIVQQVVAPALRSRSRSLDVDPLALLILSEMTKLSGTIKAWRTMIGDAFNDSRFFNGPPSSGERWRPLVKALMDGEKERMAELIVRAASPPSANIFTNRDSEMILRSLNIRRLSFVLFSAGMNHFLVTLPSIQERLVEILRTTVVSPMVHSEVYLCLRVLVCRMAPRELSNLWPIILTELLRVFEQLMEEPPADGSDILQLILAACKFLDLLLVLQSEDFQIHQWMFVTDTVDAVHRPDGDAPPESLMDRLAELVSESSHLSRAHITPAPTSPLLPFTSTTLTTQHLSTSSPPLRRPLLSHLKKITSLADLGPFFAQASMTSYEALYSGASVDWDAVDAGLEREMFEGAD